MPPAPGAWKVPKTRKGGWPLSKERRASGKWVTVISRVEGNRGALLKALKGQLGCGGSVSEDRVEIQGDHQDRVREFLDKHQG